MRYFTQMGSSPNINGQFFISGPQSEDQILPEVKALLDRPGIKEVAVLFDHGNGDRIQLFQKMKD